LKDLPVIRCTNWSEERKTEFIIKDNVGFGEWDWNILANEWDVHPLVDWGLDVWQPETDLNLDEFFAEPDITPESSDFKIILEYNEEEYNNVMEVFEKENGSKESIIYKLLTYEK
jgi:hypothetical protein